MLLVHFISKDSSAREPKPVLQDFWKQNWWAIKENLSPLDLHQGKVRIQNGLEKLVNIVFQLKVELNLSQQSLTYICFTSVAMNHYNLQYV